MMQSAVLLKLFDKCGGVEVAENGKNLKIWLKLNICENVISYNP